MLQCFPGNLLVQLPFVWQTGKEQSNETSNKNNFSAPPLHHLMKTLRTLKGKHFVKWGLIRSCRIVNNRKGAHHLPGRICTIRCVNNTTSHFFPSFISIIFGQKWHALTTNARYPFVEKCILWNIGINAAWFYTKIPHKWSPYISNCYWGYIPTSSPEFWVGIDNME